MLIWNLRVKVPITSVVHIILHVSEKEYPRGMWFRSSLSQLFAYIHTFFFIPIKYLIFIWLQLTWDILTYFLRYLHIFYWISNGQQELIALSCFCLPPWFKPAFARIKSDWISPACLNVFHHIFNYGVPGSFYTCNYIVWFWMQSEEEIYFEIWVIHENHNRAADKSILTGWHVIRSLEMTCEKSV